MLPTSVHTERLELRCWKARDADALAPILEANAHRLGGWIPAHVAAAAPVRELQQRLRRFARKFRDDSAWRFAIFSREPAQLLGEVSLFPRTAEQRTSLAEADRVEVGYWLRAEATGCGYATEAAAAMTALARSIPGVRWVEIRCDPANIASAAVPRRLGFTRVDALAVSTASTNPAGDTPTRADMIWQLPL